METRGLTEPPYRVVFEKVVPGRPGVYETWDAPPRLAAWMEREGIRLYAHQVRALKALEQARSVIVTTPTASGKSLIYQAWFLAGLERNRPFRVLYVSPLKALIQNQQAALQALLEETGHAPDLVGVLTGDTPRERRRLYERRPPPFLLTTPELLHYSLLQHAERWGRLWREVALVVLDEAHVYRGVFGIHMAAVVRRMRALLAHHNRFPPFLLLSATLANPLEHARNLTGISAFTVVGRSTAPRPRKTYQVAETEPLPLDAWIPKVVRYLLDRGHRALVFARTRKGVERAFLSLQAEGEDRVAAYRAGYLPEQRRELEEAMMTGELQAMITTSALELGIDIGDLTAVVVYGFPGSKMSFFQQCGRAGRRSPGLCVFLPTQDALDQYYKDHPEMLLSSRTEPIVLHPANGPILVQHVATYAHERRVWGEVCRREHVEALWGPEGLEALDRLEAEDPERFQTYLHRAQDTYLPRLSRAELAQRMHLRATGERYEIWDQETGELVGETQPPHLLNECYPGAIYLHRGATYHVERWDTVHRRVWVAPVVRTYDTEPLFEIHLEILRERAHTRRPGLTLVHGDVKVERRTLGYVRLRPGTHEILSTELYEEPLHHRFRTQALWLIFEDATLLEQYLQETEPQKRWNPSLKDPVPETYLAAALHAAEHAMIGLFPVVVLADRSDIGGLSTLYHEQTEHPTIFIYEGVEGGVGYTRQAYRDLPRLVDAAHARVAACTCELDSGCPGCIQSPKCGNANQILSKAGARWVLARVLASLAGT